MNANAMLHAFISLSQRIVHVRLATQNDIEDMRNDDTPTRNGQTAGDRTRRVWTHTDIQVLLLEKSFHVS